MTTKVVPTSDNRQPTAEHERVRRIAAGLTPRPTPTPAHPPR